MRWTREKIAKVEKMTLDGISYREIGKVFGVTKNSIVYITRKNKIKADCRWTPQELADIKDLIDRGVRHKDIAEKFGVTKGAITILAAKHKFKAKRSWTQKKLHNLKIFKDAGWANSLIARALDVSIDSVNSMAHLRKIAPPKNVAEKFRRKNVITGNRDNQTMRFYKYRAKYGKMREGGWLVGLLKIGSKCNNKDGIAMATKNKLLAKTFYKTLAKMTKNTIGVNSAKFHGKIYTLTIVGDKILERFLDYMGRKFSRRWRGNNIPNGKLPYYRGLIQGVFDARATLGSFGSRREIAIRLYTRRMPPGAVRNIRWALKRLGIKYTMQGGLTENERKFYKKISNKMRKLEMSGFPERKGKILLKRNFMYKDYDKRRYHFYAIPAIKIRNRPSNLHRFKNVIGFRNDILRAKLNNLIKLVPKLIEAKKARHERRMEYQRRHKSNF